MGLSRGEAHQIRREASQRRNDAQRRVARAATSRDRALAQQALERADKEYRQANRDWRATLQANTEPSAGGGGNYSPRPSPTRPIWADRVGVQEQATYGEGHVADNVEGSGLQEMHWIPQLSSNVDAFSWNEGADYKLWVRFKDGSVYAYDATERHYDDFFSAGSAGRYVYYVLRSLPYRRVY